jgi:UDP-N-acetylglucosamine--N-acetylmuramyl-(pentapeptide) pyrophosphoryl-undecaprenol N-acetylglucosamine transferase
VIGPVLIAAGGTGGHLYPALALAHELRGRGRAVALLTDRRGARFVDSDLPCHLISAGSPSGPLRQRLAGIARLALGLAQSLALFLRLRPCLAACFGGYASVPPALAAAAGRRPLLIHEQNAVLGKANRLVARLAAVIALSYEHTERVLPGWRGRVAVTGSPVRPGFATSAAGYVPPARGEPFRLLVLGGSQGARIFSDVVPGAAALLPGSLRRRLVIRQQCRPEDLDRTRAAYAALGLSAELGAFFSDVPRQMAETHLVVCRAGASTVAELLACGRPSLLVPYPHAADDHQRANAAQLQHAGAAEMLLEGTFTAGALGERLRALMEEPHRLETMARRSRAIARPDAAVRLADLVLDLLAKEARA